MTEKIRVEHEGRVARLTIARPEVRNAIDRDVFDGLRAHGRALAEDPAVRAIVVSGDDGTFSSGIDLSLFGAGIDPQTVDIASLQASFTVFELAPKPVIAAVSGVAFGAGLQLALACDFRVVEADARLGLLEVRWGILPDLGGIHRLTRLVGLARAKDLAMSGREIDGREAETWGVADRVPAPGTHLEVAMSWAAELAAGPPLAIAAVKRLCNSAFDVPVSTGLAREAVLQRRVLGSRDFGEAVAARFQKREPIFEAR